MPKPLATMDMLYAALADDLGIPVSFLPAPPLAPPTPSPLPHATDSKPRPLRRLSLPPKVLHVNVYAVGSPPRSPRSISGSHAAPPSPTSSIGSTSSTGSATQSLRRVPSPRQYTLRELRVKESEACLQKIYEQQTIGYLEGPLFRPMVPPKSKLRTMSISSVTSFH